MSKYTPDYFEVVKIYRIDKVEYKVFGTWSGSYLNGDSWRLSTKIVKVKKVGQCYQFFGASGSCYEVHKDTKGTTAYTAGVLKEIIEKANLSTDIKGELLENNMDWTQLEF